MKTVDEALDYILSVTWKGSRLGLERIQELLERLGNPQKQLKIIHIAGTNGKGSTSSMINSILLSSGYHVGLFTSPHLLSYQERIILDNQPISDEDFIAVTEQLKTACDVMENQPTVFERFTAMALLYYAQKKTDYVVLEVGLGGKLDSTNVIDSPLVAIITNLGLEHTEILGNTIEEIAMQKAGIIKPGTTCVCYDSTSAAVNTVRNVCAEKNVPFILADYKNIIPVSNSLDGQIFSYKDYENIELSLLGINQLHNVSVVLEAIEVLKQKGAKISEDAIRNGLSNVYWPARFDVLSKEPLFILDGGHNPQCIESLKENIQTYLPDTRFTFIVGVLADKDYMSELQMVLPYAEEFICLTPESDRALASSKLAEIIQTLGVKAQSCSSVSEAITLALNTERPVMAFGSLYMAGDILKLAPALLKNKQRSILRKRQKLLQIQKEDNHAVCAKLKGIVQQNDIQTIAGYKAMEKEIDCSEFYKWATENNKTVVYPKVVSDSEMIMIAFDDNEIFKEGSFHIQEPDPDYGHIISPEDIDLLLVPCLGYDENLNRIGHGKGYYDRYMASTSALRVLISHSSMKLQRIVTEGTDLHADLICTEE